MFTPPEELTYDILTGTPLGNVKKGEYAVLTSLERKVKWLSLRIIAQPKRICLRATLKPRHLNNPPPKGR